MSSIIHVLDEATRNKIAAGEVVERPASCIKELIENAIDAGASSVEVEIADGGQSYMRVTDDGCGMSAEDAKKCIIRHGTSKISSVEDIFSITSLGFRGEAVPSIAAVSHMQITTRQEGDDFATHLLLDGGVITSEDQAGAPVGTTMEVSDLFYNTPARRKFLKSERTESSKISEMVTKLALANPSIAFTFTNNGRTTMKTGGTGDLRETIANIYGAQVAREVFAIQGEQDGITLEGYVGKPSVLKSNRGWQTCIVNQRIVHNPLMFKAIDNAYHAMLPKSGYPFAMLHLRVDPAAIDVNVHPAKTEIKFSDEQAVYRAIYRSIVAALVEQEKPEDMAKTIEPPSEEKTMGRPEVEEIRIASSHPASTEKPSSPVSAVPQPAALFTVDKAIASEETDSLREERSPARSFTGRPASSIPRQERTYEPPTRTGDSSRLFSEALAQHGQGGGAMEAVASDAGEEAPKIVFEGDDDVFIPLGVVADCFIVAKKGQDLYIVDQHAAHERIRYDTFCRRVERMPSQQLLTPEFIEVDGDDMNLLLERQDVFTDLGYAYSEAGPSTLRIEEVPCDLQSSDIADSLKDICQLLHDQKEPDKAMVRHRSLAYLSCHGAVKAGDRLNIRQMKQLLDDLFHTEKPYVCPHGRPIIIRFTPKELAHLFKRT